jgi:4-amino-4-deoxy-L-arabinose transferase-like glycosyltransferase
MKGRRGAWAKGGLLGVAYVTLLIATSRALGFARDEGFYAAAAEVYAGWFDLLVHEPARALGRPALDAAFGVNHEHPPLCKLLFALSWRALRGLGWPLGEGLGFRLPGMAAAGLIVTLLYRWGSRAGGRGAGLGAALAFAFVPTTFYHAHLACLDVPVAALWLLTAYAYDRSLASPSWGQALGAALAFGLALATKHNSWFLPPALATHALLSLALAPGREAAWRRARVLGLMATFGPLTLIAIWPWLWHDTAHRFLDYVGFHRGHNHYDIEFLGTSYFRPPFPRSYAWAMTAATLPTITLALAAFGFAARARSLVAFGFASRSRPAPRLHFVYTKKDRSMTLAAEAATATATTTATATATATATTATTATTTILWALGVAVNYAPWLSSETPIFGGTKHWLPAYPFLALFAGVGFAHARTALRAAWPSLLARRLASAAALLAAFGAPAFETLRTHPWALNVYTPLVGGVTGAASLGLNRTFWGYSTGAVVDVLNARVPPGGAVYAHDTAPSAWQLLQRDGRLRADLRQATSPSGADAAVYHHEPHMAGVEYQIWAAFGTATPVAVRGPDGVPTVLVYVRGR